MPSFPLLPALPQLKYKYRSRLTIAIRFRAAQVLRGASGSLQILIGHLLNACGDLFDVEVVFPGLGHKNILTTRPQVREGEERAAAIRSKRTQQGDSLPQDTAGRR